MASNRLSYRTESDKIILTSNDSNIKQVICGFGSWGTGSGKREYPEFYGRPLDCGKVHPSEETQQWDLTMELVRDLFQRLMNYLTERVIQQQGQRSVGYVSNELKAESDVLRILGDIINGEKPEAFDAFTEAYIAAALWSTSDESTPSGGVPLDENYGVTDLSSEAIAQIRKDCEQFQRENNVALLEAYKLYVPRDGYSGAALAGHDFWLTRNGSGIQFTDRNLGEWGNLLTKAAEKFGEANIYVGDDGQLHGF